MTRGKQLVAFAAILLVLIVQEVRLRTVERECVRVVDSAVVLP